jgi:hypothetical protein
VSCSGNFCTMTLGGSGSTGEVFGTTIVLEDIRDGTATVQVGDRSTAVRQGQTVSAGRVSLRCSSVTPATVTLTGTRS